MNQTNLSLFVQGIQMLSCRQLKTTTVTCNIVDKAINYIYGIVNSSYALILTIHFDIFKPTYITKNQSIWLVWSPINWSKAYLRRRLLHHDSYLFPG